MLVANQLQLGINTLARRVDLAFVESSGTTLVVATLTVTDLETLCFELGRSQRKLQQLEPVTMLLESKE
jgi:hypothetical protein